MYPYQFVVSVFDLVRKPAVIGSPISSITLPALLSFGISVGIERLAESLICNNRSGRICRIVAARLELRGHRVRHCGGCCVWGEEQC